MHVRYAGSSSVPARRHRDAMSHQRFVWLRCSRPMVVGDLPWAMTAPCRAWSPLATVRLYPCGHLDIVGFLSLENPLGRLRQLTLRIVLDSDRLAAEPKRRRVGQAAVSKCSEALETK